MKLLFRTASNLIIVVLAFTVLAASLSVITEHIAGESDTAAAVRYEHETADSSAVSVFGCSIDLAPLKRLSDGAVGWIDKGIACLPEGLHEAADGVLNAVEDAAQAITRGLLSLQKHQP